MSTFEGTRLHRLACLAAVALASNAAAASAQADQPLSVSLSADTVEMGELFALQVEIAVPPASIVYVPDTLPATVNVESARDVEVLVEGAPAGGARLTLVYEMIAFGAGTLPVPGFDVLIAPRQGEPTNESWPGGSVRGEWSEAAGALGGSSLTRVPRQAVWVVPVFTPRDLAEGVEPMPPDDVAGGSWSWPSLGLVVLCSTLLGFTLVSTARGWREQAGSGRVETRPPTLEELRALALDALDELRREGLPTEDRLVEFYTRSSDIVRRYVEGMDADWSPSLTSGELMQRLGTHSRGVTTALGPEMASAETVKFGRRRPSLEAAEGHWRELRTWVDAAREGAP